MLRTIEVHSNGVIQKVFNQKGELIRYQACLAGNTTALTACSSLAEARNILGIRINPPAKDTKPKMSNPQNQKGYKAPTR
jgi:hypothetical protein